MLDGVPADRMALGASTPSDELCANDTLKLPTAGAVATPVVEVTLNTAHENGGLNPDGAATPYTESLYAAATLLPVLLTPPPTAALQSTQNAATVPTSALQLNTKERSPEDPTLGSFVDSAKKRTTTSPTENTASPLSGSLAPAPNTAGGCGSCSHVPLVELAKSPSPHELLETQPSPPAPSTSGLTHAEHSPELGPEHSAQPVEQLAHALSPPPPLPPPPPLLLLLDATEPT